jgi:hypothetical protein
VRDGLVAGDSGSLGTEMRDDDRPDGLDFLKNAKNGQLTTQSIRSID